MYFLCLTIGLAQYWASVQSGGAQSGAWSTTAAIISGLVMIPISYSFTSGYGYNASQGLLYPFNAPAWSLFFCELAINALYAFFRPRGRAHFLLVIGAMLAFVATTLAAGHPCGWGRYTLAGGLIRTLYGFYSGVAIFHLWTSGRLTTTHRAILPPLAVFVICATGSGGALEFLLAAIVGTPAIAALSIGDPNSAAMRSIFAWLGKISYPMYAIHVPAFGMFKLMYNWAMGAAPDQVQPYAKVFAFAIALSVACGVLADVVDAPVRAALGGLGARRRYDAAAGERWSAAR